MSSELKTHNPKLKTWTNFTNFKEMTEKTKSTKKKSKKPEPTKSKQSAQEITEIILDLARSGTPSVKIGQILKEEHGVFNVKELTGKRIVQILRENNLSPKLPADLNALVQKAATIRKHVATHKIDLEAKYGLMLTESKIRKLAKYYRREGVLPAAWKYEAEERT